MQHNRKGKRRKVSGAELRNGGSLMWLAGINENEVKTRVVRKAWMENKAGTDGIFWFLNTPDS